MLEGFAIGAGTALLVALIVFGFRFGGRSAGAWAWSWSALVAAGGCTALSATAPILAHLSPVLGAQFAFFQLQAARQDAGHPLSRSLLIGGLAFGLARGALRAAGWGQIEALLSLAVGVTLIATAAGVYRRTHGGRPAALRIAPLAAIAGMLILDGVWELRGLGVPWLPWALASVPAAALQVYASFDRALLDRDRAEDALDRSERRYRQLAEHSAVVVCELDAAGRVVWVSPNLPHVIGREPDEVVGHHVSDFISEPPTADFALDQLSGAEVQEFTIHVPHRNGSLHWLEIQMKPYEEDGVLKGVVIARDVTARRETELALAASEARLVDAQRIAHVGSWEYDARSQQLSWSDENYRLFGIEPGTPVDTRTFIEAAEPGDRQRLAQAVETAFRTGAPIDLEFRIRTPDGEQRVLHGAGEAWRDDAGAPLGMRGTSLDVTERVRAREALRQGEERLRGLLSSLGSTRVALLDRDARLIEVFPSARDRERYDATREDAIGQSVGALIGAGKAERYVARIREALDSGEPQEFRDAVTLPGGSFWWDVCLRPVHHGPGGGKAVLAVARDVTEEVQAAGERQTLEARIQETQQLESLGVLAGGIAHDFNNLLSAIQWNAEMALAEFGHEAFVRERIDVVLEATERAADLTEQLLAYAGRSKRTVESVDLSKLVEDTARLARATLPKSTELIEETEPGVIVQGDPTQLRQVAMNLLTNAAEAHADAPARVEVRTRVRYLDRSELSTFRLGETLPPGHYTSVEVRDTGCGMDPDTVARMFDPFFTTKFQGRGLGLAAALGIVRSHHGAIRVQSRIGAGSRVEVLLPLAEGLPRPDEPSVPVTAAPLPRWRILVVDDEALIRQSLAKLLTRRGFEIVAAEGGAEAVEQLREDPDAIDAVLLDLSMPRMSGIQTFNALREIRPDLPVVLMSGHAEEQIAAQLAGHDRLRGLQKPFRADALEAQMRALLP